MKKTIVVGLMLSALGSYTALAYCQADSCCVPAPANLAGWWPGDDNANDIAGGDNGSFNGSYVPGEVRDAFYIPGSGSIYVSVPQSSALEPAQVTVDAWVKANGSPGNYKYIVDKGGPNNCADPGSYALYTGANGGLEFYVSDGTNVVLSPDAGAGVWDNNWHLVAGTYDGTQASLYVDGVLVGSTPSSISAIAYGLFDNNLYIGAFSPGCTQNLSFLGSIDEVEVYSRALSQSEIQSIYAAGSGGKCKP